MKYQKIIFENWKWTVYETGKFDGGYDIAVGDNMQVKVHHGFVELIEEGTELLFGGVAEHDEANVVIQGNPKLPKYLIKVIQDYYML